MGLRNMLDVLSRATRAVRGLLVRLRLHLGCGSAVVIFDVNGSDLLQRMVLRDIDAAVLCSRFETLHITPGVVVRALANLRHLAPREIRTVRNLFGQLYRIYLLSCIEQMAPKAVITMVDNSYHFQWISRRYRGGECIAVQNGVRSGYDVHEWLPPRPAPGSVISMPNLYCFGEYERELYHEHGHDVDEFIPAGSLRGGWYLTELRKGEVAIDHDICLVSQFTEALENASSECPEVRPAIDILNGFLKRFVDETGMSLRIAMRTQAEEERAYFRRAFGDGVALVSGNRESLSTYFTMDSSRVVVALDSTAAREAFGWGKKALFCNFSGHENYRSPREGIWSLDEADYEAFRAKLTHLLALDEAKWLASTEEYRKYLMNFTASAPAHLVLRQAVERGIGGERAPR